MADFDKQFDVAMSLQATLEKTMDTEKEIVKQLGLKAELEEHIKKMNEDMGKKTYPSILKSTNDFVNALQHQVKLQKDINSTTDIQKDALLDIVKNNKEMLKQLGYEEIIKQNLADIDGVRAGKLNPLLLDQSEQFIKDLQLSVDKQTEFNERLKDLGKDSIFTQWSEKIKTNLKDFQAIVSDPKIATGLFLGASVKRAGELGKAIDGVRTDLGLSGDNTLTMSKNMAGATLSSAMLGVGMGEVAEATSAIVKETNSIKLATSKNIKEVARLSSWYGVSATEGAKLLKVFTELNHNSSDTALSTMKYAENLAIANGVPIGKLMTEVASDTEFFALYAKDGGKNLIDAANTALKLGLNMASVSNMANSLMDVESSISKEMEASVLLGKQINLQKARELAYADDMDGMMKEVLNQMGGIDEWNDMDHIKKQAIADAVGLSVSQMQTLIANQDELNNKEATHTTWLGRSLNRIVGMGKGMWEYKDLIATSMNMMASMTQIFPGIAKSIGSATKSLMQFIKGLVKKKAIEKTTSAIPTGGSVPSGAGGLAGSAQSTAKAGSKLSKGNPIVTWINSWKKMSWKALLKFAAAVGIMIITLPLLAFGLMQFNNVKWESAVMGMGSLFVMALIMKMIGKQQKDILKGSIALLILGVALIPFAFALSLMAGLDWKSIAVAGVALIGFTLAVFALGAIMSGPGAAIFGAGVLGFLMLGAALIVLAFGIKKISEASGSLIEITLSLVDLAIPMLQVGKGFIAMGIGLGLFAGGLLAMTPLIPAFMIISLVVSAMAISISLMANSMSTLTPMMMQLASIAPALSQIGLGFASIGAGLGVMAGGLMAITPFLPALAAVTAIGGIASAISGDKKEPESDKESELLNKLDTLIDLLIKGGDVVMDGKKMGKWLGMRMDTMRTHPI